VPPLLFKRLYLSFPPRTTSHHPLRDAILNTPSRRSIFSRRAPAFLVSAKRRTKNLKFQSSTTEITSMTSVSRSIRLLPLAVLKPRPYIFQNNRQRRREGGMGRRFTEVRAFHARHRSSPVTGLEMVQEVGKLTQRGWSFPTKQDSHSAHPWGVGDSCGWWFWSLDRLWLYDYPPY
jgi:hypothetical protein